MATSSPPRRSRQGPIPFLDDPHILRGKSLTVVEGNYESLGGPEFLDTKLVDFLLQRCLPASLPRDVLIGSANASEYLRHYFAIGRSSLNSDERTVKVLRRDYQYYAMRKFSFLGITCTQSHFFVIHVDFNIKNDPVFPIVRIYDSLRRTHRSGRQTINTQSAVVQMLRLFQEFMVKYAFAGMPNVKHSKKILSVFYATWNTTQVHSNTTVTIVASLLLHQSFILSNRWN
jgi:hypothetical protein